MQASNSSPFLAVRPTQSTWCLFWFPVSTPLVDIILLPYLVVTGIGLGLCPYVQGVPPVPALSPVLVLSALPAPRLFTVAPPFSVAFQLFRFSLLFLLISSWCHPSNCMENEFNPWSWCSCLKDVTLPTHLLFTLEEALENFFWYTWSMWQTTHFFFLLFALGHTDQSIGAGVS